MGLHLLPEHKEQVVLDFAGRDPAKDLRNELSAVSFDGKHLWTGSDEGRGAECFVWKKDRFVLKRRIKLDRLFPKMPSDKEADLECLDVVGGRLWLSGSHSIVRPKAKGQEPSVKGFVPSPSRSLLGSVAVDRKGRARRKSADAFAFKGKGSLRKLLQKDRHLAPFLDLPTKENGLDVEGLVVSRKSVFLGLRGPVIAKQAVVLEFPRKTLFRRGRRRYQKHFLDLNGLGVRDLAHYGRNLLVLAGPVTSTMGPFHLYLWKPKALGKKNRLRRLHRWKMKEENPEGVCYFERDGRPGVMILYDSPKERVHGSTYHADWFPLAT